MPVPVVLLVGALVTGRIVPTHEAAPPSSTTKYSMPEVASATSCTLRPLDALAFLIHTRLTFGVTGAGLSEPV